MQNHLEYVPPSVKRALFLFHGYGSNGMDMMGLGKELNLPDTAIFTPNAPRQIGPDNYEWFPLDEIDFMPLCIQTLQKLTQEAQQLIPSIQQFIKQTACHFHLSLADISVGGFSQGGLIALLTAIQTEGISKAMGLSAVPPDLKQVSVSNQPTVLLTHGDSDMVVPMEALQFTLSSLKSKNIPTTVCISPQLGHGVDKKCITEIRSFLLK